MKHTEDEWGGVTESKHVKSKSLHLCVVQVYFWYTFFSVEGKIWKKGNFEYTKHDNSYH